MIKNYFSAKTSLSLTSLMTLLLVGFLFLSACSMQSSDKIANEILTAIDQKQLTGYDITAETKRRKVILSGKVSSAADRLQAESAALETGLVEQVDNRLEISSSIPLTKTQSPALEQLSVVDQTDSNISDTQNSSLMADKILLEIKNSNQLQAYKIDAYPRGDKVQLRGIVDSLNDLQKLNQVLSNSIYSEKIINQVGVRPPLTDEEILLRAQGNLDKNGVQNAQVSVTNRVLTVSGDFNSFEEADRALTSLVGLPDLTGLISNVTVKGKNYPLEQFKIR